MDAQTITRLAKAHATLIMQYTGVSQAESFSLVSQIMQFIAGGNQGVSEPAASESSVVKPAPAQSSTGAEMAAGEGAVLARPGYLSHCSSCKNDIYEVIAEIRGKGMGVNAFCQAFRPVGHDVRLTRDTLDVVKDNTGNTYMDCPVCKGVKSLRLLGRANTPVQKTVIAPVGSIGQGEIG